MNKNSRSGKPATPKASVFLYIGALVSAFAGIVQIINNIAVYSSTVAYYVSQGYQAADVNGQLITSQLIPGLVEPLGLYIALALAMLGFGVMAEKADRRAAASDAQTAAAPVCEEAGSGDGADFSEAPEEGPSERPGEEAASAPDDEY